MSIAAVQGTPFEALAENAPTGLVGTITVKVYDPSNAATIIAATTSGITEPASGTYRALLTVPTAGTYMVRWAAPAAWSPRKSCSSRRAPGRPWTSRRSVRRSTTWRSCSRPGPWCSAGSRDLHGPEQP